MQKIENYQREIPWQLYKLTEGPTEPQMIHRVVQTQMMR